MQRRVLDPERLRHRPHRPRVAAEPVEQVDAVDAVEHDAGAAVDVDALVHPGDVRAGGVRGRQCDHLALDHPSVGGVAREPEHPPVLPGEDLRLAPGTEPLQVARRHRVRS